MEQKNITIDIPIIDLISETNSQVINMGTGTDTGTDTDTGLGDTCIYNNVLLYDFFMKLSEKSLALGMAKDFGKVGGKKHLRKSRRRKTMSKSRKTRKSRSLSGGVNSVNVIYAAFFAIVFLYMTGKVRSVLNITHDSVIQDLRSAFRVSDIFYNKHGTCAVNTLLFLKAIGLETFENLSTTVIKRKKGLSTSEITAYFNKKVTIEEAWIYHPIPLLDSIDRTKYKGAVDEWKLKSSQANRYYLALALIDDVKKKMVDLRDRIYGPGKGIVTMGGFSFLTPNSVLHAVTLWLTSNNELALIDPQRFFYTESVIIYSNDNIARTASNDIKVWSLVDYFVDTLDFKNIYDKYVLLSVVHERMDEYEDRLEPFNPLVVETITNLRKLQQQVEYRTDL